MKKRRWVMWRHRSLTRLCALRNEHYSFYEDPNCRVLSAFWAIEDRTHGSNQHHKCFLFLLPRPLLHFLSEVLFNLIVMKKYNVELLMIEERKLWIELYFNKLKMFKFIYKFWWMIEWMNKKNKKIYNFIEIYYFLLYLTIEVMTK